VAAILIYVMGDHKKWNYWHLADPLCTYIFSIIVLFTTVRIAKECIIVLMEGTPKDMEIQQFKEQLLSIKFVREVHDLHIWSLSIGKPSLSCHLVVEDKPRTVLKEATRLTRKYGIYHTTI
jgi:zinc transporter 2